MDHQSLMVRCNGADWSVYDHRPGKPDMVLVDGTEAACIAHALRIVAGAGWEMIPVYHFSDDRVHRDINPATTS